MLFTINLILRIMQKYKDYKSEKRKEYMRKTYGLDIKYKQNYSNREEEILKEILKLER